MTIQRYGTSCAPREDGVFVHFSEYEKVVAECERLRAELLDDPQTMVKWLRDEAKKLASSFDCDVYGPLFDAADCLERLFCAKEQA